MSKNNKKQINQSLISRLITGNLNNKKIETNKFLGQLESEIMEVLWGIKNGTVKDVINCLKNKKAYTTIMTVMDRLYNKKMLKRQMTSTGAYAYSPLQCKDVFCNQVSKKIINNLINEFGDVAVAQFIDIIENNDKLKEWQDKLDKLKIKK